ncbi:MAG: thioredoxin-dependent thiol peroxidase [Cyanobacteriota bacterium]
MSTEIKLKIGDKAPDLGIKNNEDIIVNLSDYSGKWVVLYFYPKDNTPGCTIEATEFTQKVDKFSDLNAVIMGVSPDSIKNHCNFIKKQSLKIMLLSDPEHKVLEAYEVWQKKQTYGKEFLGVIRTTYLINPDGKIANIWPDVKVNGHVDEVFEKLKELQ